TYSYICLKGSCISSTKTPSYSIIPSDIYYRYVQTLQPHCMSRSSTIHSFESRGYTLSTLEAQQGEYCRRSYLSIGSLHQDCYS
ncbi:MAG: hypothetical protein AAF587_44555, partial [Bacteroidota bacterium]